ncbi:hypothetical protein CONLIGDRAFT_667349 [Coniochaeta ligniaria NRRL 30616]|uniref:NACHT domain-containing protein n=1 Tax=Coniochaeta ligniaria NRRL 30616 TaxID=1408157 RepID=A0A1J7JXM2_9PEZI|nr:hypothetical protein CONLIGDRAFT_667349 [Coniochaeta ligniaria NRRL 30616]
MAAEAIALGASITAFIQLADGVIKLTKNLVDSTADMPATLRMAQAETSSLKDILGELEKLRATADTEGSTALVEATKKPLENCHSSMEQLEVELAKLSISPSRVQTAPGKRQRIKQVVKWGAGGENRVKKLVANLITEKATLSLALVADISEDVKVVKSVTAKVDRHLTEKQTLDVVRWLEHTNPSDIHNRSVDLYEKQTGEWMLRSKEWKSFVGGGHRFLWIHGIPGAGKTILISHLVSELRYRRCRDSTGWAYYYCYFGRNQDETHPFLRWIISQLCQQAAFIPSQLQELYSNRHYPDLEAALDLLARMLHKFDEVYIAIDAVDESKPYTGLLVVLTTIMTQPRFAKLRFLISSRQYLDIEEALKPHAVSVSMSNEAVQEDIRIFVNAALRSNPKFQSWPVSLYNDIEVALAKGAKGMFRWAVCQIDILSRLKSQSAVRKALTELPETLDATYERIIQDIPKEHLQFTQTTLSILAAQSELGSPGNTQMTPRALLSMILRTLGFDVSTDHFYDIFDIRETCGCLVTFATQKKSYSDWDSEDYRYDPEQTKEVVFLAHYTVKEFLYAERTAQNPSSTISRFALDEKETTIRWMKSVMDIALSARATDDPFSRDSIEDYCQGIAPLILLNTPQHHMVDSSLASVCLDLLNPGGAHHLRRMKRRILYLEWSSAPAIHPLGALTECLYREHWALARAAAKMLDARQILGTTLLLNAGTGASNRGREASKLLLETSLVLSCFLTKLQSTSIEVAMREKLEILADSVGWEALLFAASAQHHHTEKNEKNGKCPMEILIKRGANVNLAPCRMTPLQLAALRWDYDGVKLLVEKGADVNLVGSAEGYELAGANLDDGLIYDSPLRILRTASFAPPRSSIRVERAGTGGAAKVKVERLLLESGARDFTAGS